MADDREFKDAEFNVDEMMAKTITDIEDIESDRRAWLENQASLDRLYEAKEDVVHERPWPGAARYADPTTRAMVKTIYSRLFRAVFSPDPLVEPVPVEAEDVPKLDIVRTWMNWQLVVNANNREGGEEAIADWAYRFVKNGTAIMKVVPDKVERYIEEDRIVRSFEDVVDPLTGQVTKKEKRRKKKFKGNKKIWEGVRLLPINREDFFISPKFKKIDEAPIIAHRIFVSSDVLERRGRDGIWDEEVVQQVLAEGRGKENVDEQPNALNQILQQTSDELTGIMANHGNFERDEHEILEVYRTWDLNGDGLEEEAVFWIHRKTRRLLRWEYLEECAPDRKRPFVGAFYDFRENEFYVGGVAEELQSSQEEINYMRNNRVNWGTLTSIPSGTYEPTLGTSPEKIAIEPGAFFPAQNVRPFNFPDRSGFGAQEEAFLKQNVRELVGVGDIQLGQIDQSSTFFRTASGPIATLQEANIRYAVIIKRFQWALRDLFHKVYLLTVGMAEPGMVIRITGQGGGSQFMTITEDNMDALIGQFDFTHRATADTAFPSIEQNKAIFALNTALNPVMIQLGITTPSNIYELAREVMHRAGIQNINRFISRPPDFVTPPRPFEEVIGLIIQDMPVSPSPLDNIEENLAKAQLFMASVDFGALTEPQIGLLENYIGEALQLRQQQQAAALVQSQPEQQALNGQAGTLSPESSANDRFAAQPTNEDGSEDLG